MLRKGAPYLAGFLMGLLSTGLMLHFAAGPRGQPIMLHPPPAPPPLRVHVAGAVVSPGVYSLPAGSIVADAISLAGGALPQAETGAINLAAALGDGERVFVPNQMEASTADSTDGTVDTNSIGLVPINQAFEPELERLPGIGPSLAAAIVQYRREHGHFDSIEGLLNVPGIGPAKLEAVRDLVRLD